MAALFRSRMTLVCRIAIYLTFGVMLAVSWRRWTSPIADSGREMDLPRRLAAGEALYRDVHYIYPPLSPYLNSFLYRIAGPNLEVLWISGVLCAILLVACCHQIARRLLDPPAAALASGAIVLFCIFKPGGNLIFPYAYAALHGTLFALASLLLALRYGERKLRSELVLAGILIGLAAITKQEFAVAAALCVAASILYSNRGNWPAILRELLVAAAPAAVITGAIYAGLLYGFGWETIVEDCHLFFTHLPASLRFYNAQRTGTDRPLFSLLQMLGGASTAVAAMSGIVLVSTRGWKSARWPGLIFLLSIFSFALIRVLAGRQWDGSPIRALPFLLLGMIVFEWRRRDADEKSAARFVIAVYSMAILARVALRVPSGGAFGGFFLPTSLILFVWLFTSALPRLAEHWLGEKLLAQRMRKTAFGMLAVTILISAVVFGIRYRRNFNYEIVAAHGHLYAPKSTGPAIDEALRFIESSTRPGESIAVFPEGSDLAFLTGRAVHLRHQILIPELMLKQDEQRAIEKLREDGTRYVFIVNRPMREFGKEAFGRDFYTDLGGWVESNYRLIKVCGRAPNDRLQIGDREFFIKIYGKKDQ